ncbi:hypothetical protein [Turicibacter sanguinis]|uniref:hypothetical protein n=1 Tax=Turicibacter sanguinis TaxID=154288 RepID=UPI0018A90D82|nr:hypothetical protein [Turicibacter sanguinis]
MTKELNNTDNKSSMKKRFRRNNQQMKQIKEEVVDLLLESLTTGTNVTIKELKNIYNKYGLSDATIHNDRNKLGIKCIQKGKDSIYVLNGTQQSRLLAKKIANQLKYFKIYHPISYKNELNLPFQFNDLTLYKFYLAPLGENKVEDIERFKCSLLDYLNSVNNLYGDNTLSEDLFDYFFNITDTKNSICFEFTNQSELLDFLKLIDYLSTIDLSVKTKKSISIYRIKKRKY